MKTTTQKKMENNFKIAAKSIGVYFILLTLLHNSDAKANILTNGKNDSIAKSLSVSLSDTPSLKKPTVVIEIDSVAIVVKEYKKTIDEIIEEDKLIIESTINNGEFPLNMNIIDDVDFTTLLNTVDNKPLEELIKENNLIIENSIPNETLPLNLKCIDTKPSKTKEKITTCFSMKCLTRV